MAKALSKSQIAAAISEKNGVTKKQANEILAKAGVANEQVLVVPVDLKQVDATRTHWPFLRDRRIDAYGDLTKRLID